MPAPGSRSLRADPALRQGPGPVSAAAPAATPAADPATRGETPSPSGGGVPAVVGQARLGPGWAAAGVGAVVVAALVGVMVGPVFLRPDRIVAELVDGLPLVSVDSGLSAAHRTIIWDIRLPRVVLGLVVGALLATAGASYQGVFRNPLADPYLLGVAAGAGLGATLVIVGGGAGDAGGGLGPGLIPVAAFAGALAAVVLTLAVGGGLGRSTSTASLLLAGVAVASFFTAVQTYVQQRDPAALRQVYAWILGRLSTGGWSDVTLLLPYAAVSLAVLLALRGPIDVLAVGEDEARSLGLRPERIRWVVIVAASLAAASAVAVSGLISFVGLIVPHAVRMAAGVSNRRVLPLSVLFGGAFLALTDVLARTLQSPAEIPIGVVTAFFGAPFFLLILHRTTRSGL